jgi:small-conductance mechanosensitive channel
MLMGVEKIILIIVLIIGYFVIKNKLKGVVARIGDERSIAKSRIQYVTTIVSVLWSIAAFIIIGVIAGVDYDDVGVYFTSIFAVIGVAMVAQWSILSNATSSLIIFFFFPFRVGCWVKVLDATNTVEGIIDEITLFHLVITTEDGSRAVFPNSLVFQKAILVYSCKPEKTPLSVDDAAQENEPLSVTPNQAVEAEQKKNG